jgi:gliding motility-associated-like protein
MNLNRLIIVIIIFFCASILDKHTVFAQNCVTIESILVDACGSPEIDNEMLRFRVGSNPLNIANMNMTFGIGQPFLGIQNPNSITANKTAGLNATIQSCGFLKEPIGGVLPANSKVLVVGSFLISTTQNSFANLSDTLIILYIQQSNWPDAYFINAPGPIPPPNAQTTTVSFGGGCTSSATYLRSNLITSTGAPATATNGNGAFVNFDDNGAATYGNNGCSALYTPFSAQWTNPSPLCEGNGIINLNQYITGNTGGVWSGPGVSGNQLNLAGLSGSIQLTYTINVPGCGNQSETKTITLIDCCLPVTFNAIPSSIACDANSINLIANQTGFAANESITPCFYIQVPTNASHNGLQARIFENGLDVGTLNISPNANFSGYFSFASPSATNTVQLCEPASAIIGGNTTFTIRDCHSNQVLASGTWVMDGACQTVNVTPPGSLSGAASWSSNSNGLVNVTDWGAAQFSPAAAGPGSWDITYCWDNGAGCQDCQTKSITVTSNNNANWTVPPPICENQTSINFAPFVTGTAGGTWSGQGMSPNGIFNPSGLSGNVVITYTVGTGACAASVSQDVSIIAPPNANWTSPGSICQSQTVSLNPLVTGTTGGTWSGQGVSGNTFNSSGLSGDIAITYTVGTVGCQSTSTQNINVVQNATATWTGLSEICNSALPINLNLFVSGTGGGTWTVQGAASSGTFNPSGLSGNISINYSVGSGTCAASFDAVINIINAPPIPSITGETEFCENATFTPLTASGTGNSFQWYNNAGLNNPIATGISFTPNTNLGSTYWLTQTVGNCVSEPLIINLTINPAPAPPTIPTQYTYCESSGFPELIVSAGTGIINWYSDAQLNNLVNTGTSYQPIDANVLNFWITQTVNGCVSNPATTSLIAQNPVSANINPQGPITLCPGESITLRSNSSSNNLWSTGETTESIVVSSAGVITLSVTGECNTATDQINVLEESVEASFEIDKSSGFAPLIVNFTNTSSNSGSCVWLINNIPNDQLFSGTFTFEERGSFAVTLICTTPGGCEDRMTKVITVGEEQVELYIPNSFTPNGDNVNDKFKVYGVGISTVNVQIYNRWGELIYQWNGLEEGWDGTVANRLAPQDVYAYIIYGIDNNGNRIKRLGAVTLLGD